MKNQISQRAYSQRQLRVGELVKQNLGELFIRNEAKIPSINSKLVTVTEVRMTPDLKTARVYVIPLGGIDTKETVKILTEFSHLVRKALSKRLDIKSLAIHNKDVGSAEIQIGLLTDKITRLSEHFKKFKKDKHSTLGLAKSVNKRKKLLAYLKKRNNESYNKVIKQLNLRK